MNWSEFIVCQPINVVPIEETSDKLTVITFIGVCSQYFIGSR